MLALDSGYPYKRSHLVALRPTKISAMDPPCRLKACPVYPESRHQTDRSACRLSAISGSHRLIRPIHDVGDQLVRRTRINDQARQRRLTLLRVQAGRPRAW